MAVFGQGMVSHRRPRPSGGAAPAPGPSLITASDLVFQGSFRPPLSDDVNGHNLDNRSYTIAANNSGMNDGNYCGYNPSRGSLFVTSATGVDTPDHAPVVAEITIPTPLITGDTTALPAAAWLQPLTLITDYYTALSLDVREMKGMWCDGSNLFFTLSCIYDNSPPAWSHGYVSSCNAFSGTANQHGMYALATPGGPVGSLPVAAGTGRQVAGHIVEIPAAWRPALGGFTHLSGNSSQSIVGHLAACLGLIAFDINSLGATPAPSFGLVWFDTNNNILQPDFDTNSEFPRVCGGGFVDTPSLYGLVMFGYGPNLGVEPHPYPGASWYGFGDYATWYNYYGPGGPGFATDPYSHLDIPPLHPGQSHYGTFGSAAGWPSTDTEGRYYVEAISVTVTNKGGHASDWSVLMWVIDPNDLVRVYNGEILPWGFQVIDERGNTFPPPGGATPFGTIRKYGIGGVTSANPLWAADPAAMIAANLGYGVTYDRAGRRWIFSQTDGFKPDPVGLPNRNMTSFHVYGHR